MIEPDTTSLELPETTPAASGARSGGVPPAKTTPCPAYPVTLTLVLLTEVRYPAVGPPPPPAAAIVT